MLIKLDKFFVMALQEAGYDLDYKKIKEIYSRSRQHPEQKARSQFNQMINGMMYESFEASNDSDNSEKKPKKTRKED